MHVAQHPGDPRTGWGRGGGPHPAPALRHRRDGILPTTAAALSADGTTLTSTAGRGEHPPAHHPLVRDALDALAPQDRTRHAGRCPEALLLSRYLTTAEAARGKRAARKPLTPGEARRALAGARITVRHLREEGDPQYGTYAPPCRSCAALLAHFGVTAVDPAAAL